MKAYPDFHYIVQDLPGVAEDGLKVLFSGPDLEAHILISNLALGT